MGKIEGQRELVVCKQVAGQYVCEAMPCSHQCSLVKLLIVLVCKGLNTVCIYGGLSASSSSVTMGHKGPRGGIR